MKRIAKALLLMGLLCLTVSAYAGRTGNIETAFNAVTINGTNTYYSRSYRLSLMEAVGLMYKATSATGTPDIKIQVEMSYDRPTVEGGQGTAGTGCDVNWIEPTGMADVEAALVAETWQIQQLTLPPMKYVRFRVDGNATNAADTVLTMYLFQQDN